MSNEQCPGSQSNREINKQRLVPRPCSLFLIALCSLFTFHFSLFFVSCTTLSHVEGPAESVEAVTPRWAPQAPGLDYFAGKVSRPRIEFYALRVDLTAPNLRIVVVPGGGEYRRGFLSVKVSSFVRDNGLLAGINALPFDLVSGTEGEPRLNVGLVIADGVTLSPPHKSFDALVFYKDGHAAIVAQSEITNFDSIENAVGGFFRILEYGELVPRVLNLNDRHPRSAAGISPDNKFLYLLVIDGRQIKSVGCTEAQTALLLRALGATEAINFDGGGSSALVLRYPGGKFRVVNIPIHDQIPGRERAVAGCLGIGTKEK
jgi:hypothetical protein